MAYVDSERQGKWSVGGEVARSWTRAGSSWGEATSGAACDAGLRSRRSPATAWELSSEGWCEAKALARALPAGALLIASRELKARQTLEPAGPVQADERFNEVTRDEPHEGDFRVRRRAYVTGTDHTGWEPRDHVVARFTDAVRFWNAQADGRPLVIASHGMAITLWLTATVGLTDAGEF